MQYSGHNTPLGHYTDCGPIGLGQYNSLGEYYGPNTASSVFLILIFYPDVDMHVRIWGIEESTWKELYLGLYKPNKYLFTFRNKLYYNSI